MSVVAVVPAMAAEGARSDSDGDRLSNRDEVVLCGTNPRRRDTDGDGLSDGSEVLDLGTDPLRVGLRISPCRIVARGVRARALVVDRNSLGGRCDDARAPAAVTEATPWCSLERAETAAGGGRTVYVRRGHYPRLVLRGKRAAYLTLKPFGRERVTLAGLTANDSTFLPDGVHAGDAGYLRLEGFAINGPVELLFGTRKIALVHNDITSYLLLRLTRDVLIARNHIHDSPRGTRVIGADGYAENPARAGIHGLTIRANLIERASYDAIAVYGGAYGLRVERNEIAKIHRPPGSGLHVDGIQTQGGHDIRIRDNFIHDVDQGVFLADRFPLERLVVANNVIARTEGWAMSIKDAPGARILANTIWDSGAGLGIFDTAAISGPPTSVTLRNNIVDWLQLERQSYIGVQDHNLIARRGRGSLPRARRPRFRNRKRLDYRLARRSAGVNAGTRRGVPVRDALRVRRSGHVDIGALEHTRR